MLRYAIGLIILVALTCRVIVNELLSGYTSFYTVFYELIQFRTRDIYFKLSVRTYFKFWEFLGNSNDFILEAVLIAYITREVLVKFLRHSHRTLLFPHYLFN